MIICGFDSNYSNEYFNETALSSTAPVRQQYSQYTYLNSGN